jgi:hypothetical protein
MEESPKARALKICRFLYDCEEEAIMIVTHGTKSGGRAREVGFL